MAKYGVQLRDANGDSLYPRTILEQIYNMAGSARLDVLLSTMRENLEGDIADTNLAVERLREDLNALLSNATLSGAVLDAIVEIKTLLDSNSSDVVAALVTTMSALRDEAIRNVAQELTLSQKQQARTNVGAVGVKYTDNRGTHLEQAGEEIMPYTKAGNVEYRGSNLDTLVNVLDERSSETKEKVDTFLADADTSEQAIDKLKELQDYIKNDETSASQMLGDIAQNKQDIAKNATNIDKEATRAKQTEMYLESQKVNKYGYYENLSVGVADNLSGRGEATESEFSFRPSGGKNKSIPEDGTARINTIKGNSVVWNQLLMPGGWFLNKGLPSLVNNSTLTNKGDGFEYVANSEITNTRIWISNNVFQTKMIIGHKYIFVANGLRSNLPNSVPLKFYSTGDSVVEMPHDNGIYKSFLFTNGLKNENQFALLTDSGITIPAGTYIKGRVDVVDLTKMFGSGNEPTTVEEFEALYGNMPNEYNEGDIIDNHTTAIKSVGVNAWDEEITFATIGIESGNVTSNPERIASKNFCACIGGAKYYVSKPTEVDLNLLWYDKDENFLSFNYCYGTKEFTTPTNARFFKINLYKTYGTIYNHDICIHLVHTGYLNGKYFPYESQTRQLPTVEGGLKSAGSAYDEIRYNKGKDKWEHVQRVGIVDLGELRWSVVDGYPNKRWAATLPFRSTNLGVNKVSNGLCSKFPIVTMENTYFLNKEGVAFDAVNVTLSISGLNPAEIDNDSTAIKQAMQGVILYYELAEPVVTELDVDISPDYKVWDYGTEEAISEVLSTPVRINSNYGFNAVGQITDNTELIKELLARVAVLEAQIAQANSTNVEPIEPIVE